MTEINILDETDCMILSDLIENFGDSIWLYSVKIKTDKDGKKDYKIRFTKD
jgi:hypothetical protein